MVYSRNGVMSHKIIIILFWVLLKNLKTWPTHFTALGFGLYCLIAITITVLFSHGFSSIVITSLKATLFFCSKASFFIALPVLVNRLTSPSLILLIKVFAFRNSQMIDRVFDKLLRSFYAHLSLSLGEGLFKDCLL